jgi:hypothetical protein
MDLLDKRSGARQWITSHRHGDQRDDREADGECDRNGGDLPEGFAACDAAGFLWRAARRADRREALVGQNPTHVR